MTWYAAELEPLLAVVAATLDPSGHLLEGNAGFRSLIEADGADTSGKLCAEFFIQPRFGELAGGPASEGEKSYQGLLTMGSHSGQTRTLRAQVWRSGTELRILAEYDIAGLEQLNHLILDINRESAETQRTLVQNNLTIKRLNAELERHRQQLEEMVAARTAELSLALAAAQAANQAKSRFLAVMSHELRTPLNGMMGMTGLALRLATDPKQIGWLNKGMVSGQRLLNLVNDVLEMSTIESGQLSLAEVCFSVAEIVADVHQQHESAAVAKGLRLVQQLPPALPGPLRGDATRLKQILTNFVSNAVKFSEHGQISVRASVTPEDNNKALLRFEVSDQGVGLSQAEQAMLFQPFSQVDDSTTRKHGGIGLGLTLAKQFAQLMGGEVGVHSAPGQGSTFWATARVACDSVAAEPPAQAGGPPVASHPGRPAASARVLVVEDDLFNQEVAQSMLENVGLLSDVANNGQEALEMIAEGNYALVLMDMRMPVMDGLEASRAIRALPDQQKASLPIVALTANTFGEDRDKCMAAGMDAFLSKPATVDVLWSCLSRWLAARAVAAA